MEELTHDMDSQKSKDAFMNMQNNPFTEKEYVPLVSRGYFLPIQFKGIDQILVRKLNWEDEDILTTPSYYTKGILFNELLKNTVVDDRKIPSGYLTNADKDVILWWLRIGAFGPEYRLEHTCPSCGHKHTVTWNLGNFTMPEYSEHILDELKENGCLTIELPISKLKCQIIPGMIGREEQIQKKLKEKKEKEKSTKDYNITGKLLSIIKRAWGPNGELYETFDGILQWLQTGNNGGPISLSDSRFIMASVKEIDLKVNTKMDLVCPDKECGNIEEQVEMPMTINFFYPNPSL